MISLHISLTNQIQDELQLGSNCDMQVLLVEHSTFISIGSRWNALRAGDLAPRQVPDHLYHSIPHSMAMWGSISHENCHEQWHKMAIWTHTHIYICIHTQCQTHLFLIWAKYSFLQCHTKFSHLFFLGIYPKYCCGWSMTCMVNHAQESWSPKRITVLDGGFERFSILKTLLEVMSHTLW